MLHRSDRHSNGQPVYALHIDWVLIAGIAITEPSCHRLPLDLDSSMSLLIPFTKKFLVDRMKDQARYILEHSKFR